MLAELRRDCPVAWSEHHGGFWVVTTYDDVSAVFRDQTRFSSSRQLLADPESTAFNIPSYKGPVHLPTELDPPEHVKYRRLISGLLGPKEVALLRPRVEHWSRHFLERALEAGACDPTYDYSSPLPRAVTLEWLGLPAEEAPRISHAYHDLLGFEPGHPRMEEAAASLGWMYDWVTAELEDRARSPRDDILSWLLAQEIDGKPVEFDKAFSLVTNLI